MTAMVSKPELWAAERFLDMIKDAKKVPWVKPWSGGGTTPKNVKGRPYNGMNRWLLTLAPYNNLLFLTFNQAKDLGGTVKKGEKAWPVFFWSFPTADDKAKGKRPFCKGYSVFNIDQCEGLDLSKVKDLEETTEIEFQPIEEAEAIVNRFLSNGGPGLQHIEQRAYYSPSFDKVNMPKKETFKGIPEYYSTLFHELGHSTGHESRLKREFSGSFFGSHLYSEEELVAELCAAEILSHCHIDNEDTERNSIAYCQAWYKRLKDDPACLARAARAASKAARLIMQDSKNEE